MDDDEKKHICEKYKPIACNFIKNETNKNISRNTKLINVIEQCKKSKIDYDLILITRFDLLFKIDFNKSNIKLDKFNLVSILEKEHLICDNFYLFPYNILDKFYNIIKINIHKSNHLIKNDIENINGKDFINYILNENTNIRNLTFYKIVRTLSN